MQQGLNAWIKRNLPHTLIWSDGVRELHVSADERWLCVAYLPNAIDKTKSIRLDIKLSDRSAKVADLVGNGEGSSYHNRKIGTLLANIAVQALRVIYSTNPEHVVVSGETCPATRASEGQAHLDDVARRAHFWSRIGFVIQEPLNPRSYMSATVAELKIVDRNNIMEGIPTTLQLSQFWRKYHTPRLFTPDIEAVKNVEFPVGDLVRLPTKFSLNTKELTLNKWASYPSTLYSLMLFGVCGFFLFSDRVPDFFKGVFVLIALVTYPTVTAFIFQYTKIFLSWLTGYTKLNEERTRVLKEKRAIINDLENVSPGALQRVLNAMKSTFPESVGQHLIANGIKCNSNVDEREFFQDVGILIKDFQKPCAGLINIKRIENYQDTKDFIFTIDRNYIYTGSLTEYAEFLQDDFDFHINRFLREIPGHTLHVSGSTEADPRKILDKLNNISRIDFYTDSCVYSDYGSFHMKVHLQEGTLNFRASWSTYKPTRIQECIGVLLYLANHNLIAKSFIVDGDARIKVPEDALSFICAVFDLANCKTYLISDVQEAINRHNWIEQSNARMEK